VLQAVANLSFSWLALVVSTNGAGVCDRARIHQRDRTVIFVAYLSALCRNPLHTATQYALLTALAAVGRTYLSSAPAMWRSDGMAAVFCDLHAGRNDPSLSCWPGCSGAALSAWTCEGLAARGAERRVIKLSRRPRESGGPSIPETSRRNREAAAYWVGRSSRAMTVVLCDNGSDNSILVTTLHLVITASPHLPGVLRRRRLHRLSTEISLPTLLFQLRCLCVAGDDELDVSGPVSRLHRPLGGGRRRASDVIW